MASDVRALAVAHCSLPSDVAFLVPAAGALHPQHYQKTNTPQKI